MRSNIKLNIRKVRRGKRKSKRNNNIPKSMRFVGVNAAGLKSKLLTFKKMLNELNPSVFLIEETKFKEEGKFKIDNFIIFELVRQS